MPEPLHQFSCDMPHCGEPPKLHGSPQDAGFRCMISSLPSATPGQLSGSLGLPSISRLFPGYVNGDQRSDSGSILPQFAPAKECNVNSGDAAVCWPVAHPSVAQQTPIVTVDGSVYNFAQPPPNATGWCDFGAPVVMSLGYPRIPPTLGSLPTISLAMSSDPVVPIVPVQPVQTQGMSNLADNSFLYAQSMGIWVAPSMHRDFPQVPDSAQSQTCHVPVPNPCLPRSLTQTTQLDTVPDLRPATHTAAFLTVSPQNWLGRTSGTLGSTLACPAPSAQKTRDFVASEVSQDHGSQESGSRTGSRGIKRSTSKMAGEVDSDEEGDTGSVRCSLFPYDSVDEALAVEYPHFHTITDLRERRLIRNRIAAKACRARKKETVDELSRKLDEERTTAAELRARCSNLERENNRLTLELGRFKDWSHTVQTKLPPSKGIMAPATPNSISGLDHRGSLELAGRPLVTFSTVIPGVTASSTATKLQDQVQLSDEPSDSGSQCGLDLLLFAAQHVEYVDFTAAQPPPSEVYQQRACRFRV